MRQTGDYLYHGSEGTVPAIILQANEFANPQRMKAKGSCVTHWQGESVLERLTILYHSLTQHDINVSDVDGFILPGVLTVQVDGVENVDSKRVDGTQQHDGVLQQYDKQRERNDR